MRTTRRAACAAALAALTVSPAATAAATPCRLVVDARGDQSDKNVTGMVRPVSTDLDLLSADIASDDGFVTAVFRVATLRELDPGSPGHHYLVEFRVEGRPYAIGVTHGVDGTNAFVRGDDHSDPMGHGTVVVDHDRREVRVSAPARTFRVTAGKRLTGLVFWSAEFQGVSGRHDEARVVIDQLGTPPGGTMRVDFAEATRPYVAGTATCVPVGK